MMPAPITITDLQIRPFTPNDEDYAAWCAVNNAVFPEYADTPDEVRRGDARREEKIRWGRFFAVEDGKPIGTASYGQASGAYHPRRFYVGITVLPEHEGRGVGKALYERLMRELAPYDPLTLRTSIREDASRALRFAADRGFVEEMREQESRLDLNHFDPAAYVADLKRVEDSGIVLKTVAQLRGTDPDWKQKLNDLSWLIGQDIPHTEELTRVDKALWARRFEDPNFLWDANVVAVDPGANDAYVGTSTLWDSQGTDDLFTGTTGVLREYRGRGLATALKVRALSWAKSHGKRHVRTWNEVNNNGMLGINFRLGFVRLPQWLEMVRQIPDTEPAAPETGSCH